MIWKDLLLMKFENGFRILNNKDTEDKFFVIDDVRLKIGETYRIGYNGYFERKSSLYSFSLLGGSGLIISLLLNPKTSCVREDFRNI